ncbi:MAG: hypothetical protein ACYS18_02730 [Planctomycetota bacterium]|jgi:hypothetical protein
MAKGQDLIEAVVEKAKELDGRRQLTCKEAFGLAEEFGTEILEVGRICNQQNIRIRHCQLGCFK